MDRIKVNDCVKLKHIFKRKDEAVVNPVGVVNEIDGMEFWVFVIHHDSDEPVPYVCYENELEKLSGSEYFRCLLAGYNDLPNIKDGKIKI